VAEGIFIVFEGGDGVGKSTQARKLADWAASKGREVVLTFEPGDTPIGAKLRGLVLDPAWGDVAPRAEALMYAADKAQHVHEVVLPALQRGAVVISDRYVDSMLAYQGAGRALEPDRVEQMARWATQDLLPDLTVLLDLDPERGLATIAELDRVEGAGADFHVRARQFFLDLAARDPEHYLVLPARTGVKHLAQLVRERVAPLLSVPTGTVGP
jgi:dTMP kinase